MDPEPKDVIVLGAIRRGEKKFDKIQRITQVNQIGRASCRERV